MSTNAEVAKILEEIADLLDLAGEKFKPEAYRRAARSIEALPEDLRKVADRGGLRSIPGIGEAIEEKIREFLRDGTIAYYERLKSEFPAGVVAMMRLPGLGPKTARRFLLELKIEGPSELREAIDAGRLNGVKGFGPRKIALLREAVTKAATTEATASRTALWEAWNVAETIIGELRTKVPIDQIEAAGSLRRRRETVGDLDILATSRDAEKVFDAFSALPNVREVKLRGGTKETIVYGESLQVDLRVVDPQSFGAALQYFTGSKDHNIHLRSIARDRGLKVNEYGVFRGEERLEGSTEAEVYATLGLPWIPPEIRENQGEIDAAQAGTLPTLIETGEIRGDLHVHLPRTATNADLDRLLEEARRRGWQYVGVVFPRKDGTSSLSSEIPELAPRLTELSERRGRGDIAVWIGEEVAEVGGSESHATASGVDYWILRPSMAGDEGGMAPPDRIEGIPPLLAGHFPSQGPKAPLAGENLVRWMEWTKQYGVALEITPRAGYDGLDALGARRAIEAGVGIHVTAGITGVAETAPIDLAVGIARRGWATKSPILNTLSREELRKRRRASFHSRAR